MFNTLVVSMHIVAALGTLAIGTLLIARGRSAVQRTPAYVGCWCLLFGTGLMLGWQRAGMSATEVLSAAGFACVLLATYVSATAERADHAWQRLLRMGIVTSFALLVAAAAHQALPLTEMRFAWWIGALIAIMPVCLLLATTIRPQPIRSSARQ